MQSTFESLTLRPPRSAHDRRIERLERTCKTLRQYHTKAGAKQFQVMRLVLLYENLLDNIQEKLGV